MTQQFLLPKARDLETGQTVKIQDLTGARFLPSQRRLAEARADQLAETMTQRTGRPWQGFTELYTPTHRRT